MKKGHRIGSRARWAALLLAAVAAPVAGCAAQNPADRERQERAVEVLTRTKETRTPYSLFLWTRVTPPGEAPREEWSAEFHSGHLHRVETPNVRLVADCRAGTGTAIQLDTGETTEGPEVARVGCGINTNRSFDRAEHDGVIQTAFGPADRVRLIDEEMIREYDVSKDGVLVRTKFRANSEGQPQILLAETAALLREEPDPAMFDLESLERSFVPETYRRAPAPR